MKMANALPYHGAVAGVSMVTLRVATRVGV